MESILNLTLTDARQKGFRSFLKSKLPGTGLTYKLTVPRTRASQPLCFSSKSRRFKTNMLTNKENLSLDAMILSTLFDKISR